MSDYADIVDQRRPVSSRPPMPRRDRAAQFSPFAALTGHRESLAEAARAFSERVSAQGAVEAIESSIGAPVERGDE